MCSTCERFFWIKKTKALISMFGIFRNWNTFKNEVEKFSDKAVVLFHYLLLVVSVSGNFLIRSDKCVANFPYYVSLMWAPEAKSSSIGGGGALKQDPLRKYSATNCWQFYLKCKCALTTFSSTTMHDEIFRMVMLKHDLVSVVLMVFYKAHLPPTLVPPTRIGEASFFLPEQIVEVFVEKNQTFNQIGILSKTKTWISSQTIYSSTPADGR